MRFLAQVSYSGVARQGDVPGVARASKSQECFTTFLNQPFLPRWHLQCGVRQQFLAQSLSGHSWGTSIDL